jgi:hypothetical protein
MNYAHWLPVHISDMISLEQQHPEVTSDLHKGNFVIHKSRREFSALVIKQAHAQSNSVIKDDRGGCFRGPRSTSKMDGSWVQTKLPNCWI